jgi:hypothetical protein
MATDQAPSEPTLLKTLADVSTLAAAISFGVLCIAFVHEWAYFGVVGRQFQSLMSPSDYVSSAISWLPLAVGTFLIGYLIEHFVRRTEGFRSEAEIAATYPTVRRWWWVRQFPWVVGRWLALVNAGLVLLVLNIYLAGPMVALGITVLWYACVQWYLGHPRIAAALTDRQRSALLFVPVIGVWVFLAGQSSGYSDLTTPHRLMILKPKSDSERNVVLLRTFGAGLLIREPVANRVAFTKWDEISSISYRTQLPDNRSYLCSIWERGCSEEQRVPNP